MYHQEGYIDIKSVNSSHNEATRYSSLRCRPSSTNGGTYGTTISYSSFSNNTASSYCIYLWYHLDTANKDEIINSNIIENSGDQTIYIYATVTFTNTCIMRNTDLTYVFYIASGFTCALIDCSFDNIQKTGSGSLARKGSPGSFIHGLAFISTGDCVNI